MAVHRRRKGNRADRDPAQAAQAGGADKPHIQARAGLGGPQASSWAALAQTLVMTLMIVVVMLWQLHG